MLDDGTIITESIAICRYFEGLQPEPPLFGPAPRRWRVVEMWKRRVEFHLLAAGLACVPQLASGDEGDGSPQVPAWAEANKPRVMDFLGVARPRA